MRKNIPYLVIALMLSLFCKADVLNFPEGIAIPPFMNLMSGGPSALNAASSTVDASGEKTGATIVFNKTGNVRALVFGIITTTTGDPNFITSLQTLDANDEPSGTPYCVDSSTTMAIVAADDNTILQSRDFNSDCAVVAGDRAAIVLERPASAGTVLLGGVADNSWDSNSGVTVSSISTAGWVKQNIGTPSVALMYSDGSLSIPWGTILTGTIGGTQAAANNTNPNFVGNRFKLNFPATSIGAWGWGDYDGNSYMHLSDGSNVYLSTCASVGANRLTVGGIQQACIWNNPVELSSGTYYWLFNRPITTTSSAYYQNNFKKPEYSGISDGAMYDVIKSTALNPTSSADWSIVTNQRMYMGIIVDKITTTSGGASPTTKGWTYAN